MPSIGACAHPYAVGNNGSCRGKLVRLDKLHLRMFGRTGWFFLDGHWKATCCRPRQALVPTVPYYPSLRCQRPERMPRVRLRSFDIVRPLDRRSRDLTCAQQSCPVPVAVATCSCLTLRRRLSLALLCFILIGPYRSRIHHSSYGMLSVVHGHLAANCRAAILLGCVTEERACKFI